MASTCALGGSVCGGNSSKRVRLKGRSVSGVGEHVCESERIQGNGSQRDNIFIFKRDREEGKRTAGMHEEMGGWVVGPGQNLVSNAQLQNPLLLAYMRVLYNYVDVVSGRLCWKDAEDVIHGL